MALDFNFKPEHNIIQSASTYLISYLQKMIFNKGKFNWLLKTPIIGIKLALLGPIPGHFRIILDLLFARPCHVIALNRRLPTRARRFTRTTR